MRLIVAGGGTAGHTAPILAVLDALEEYDTHLSVLYIGTGAELEKRLISSRKIEYVAISAGKYRRYNRGWVKAAFDVKTTAQNIRDLLRTNRAIIQSSRIISKFKPDVVFIKGGYVGLPVGIAARRKNIPIVLHDSDSVLGLANKMLAKSAQVLATGFPIENYSNYKLDNLVFVGNPLRKEAKFGSIADAKKYFGIKEQKPNVLLFGGSRGAQKINDAVFENLNIIAKHYNVVHITGKQGIEQARFLRHRLADELQDSYQPHDFLENHIGLAYALADLVVCRAGANSIAELAYWEKPAILIPYESAANNEQFHNAEVLARAGAARLMHEDDLSGMRLVSEIDKLMDNKSERMYLSDRIARFSSDDADQKLAKIIYQTQKSIKEVSERG